MGALSLFFLVNVGIWVSVPEFLYLVFLMAIISSHEHLGNVELLRDYFDSTLKASLASTKSLTVIP
jgi:hypothetical protein